MEFGTVWGRVRVTPLNTIQNFLIKQTLHGKQPPWKLLNCKQVVSVAHLTLWRIRFSQNRRPRPRRITEICCENESDLQSSHVGFNSRYWLHCQQECIPVGCVPAAGRPYAGVCFPGGCLPGLGGSTWSGGVCLVWGVSAWSRGDVCQVPGGCLPGPGGGIPACTEADPLPPCEQNEWQTGVKILPWPQLHCGQ